MFQPPREISPEVRRLRTVNLHTHLEGSVQVDTFMDLARDLKFKPPFAVEKAASALQVNGSEKSLVDYLEKIAQVYPILKNTQALRRVAYEAALSAASNGVIYFELRGGPLLHSLDGPPLESVFESILEGLKAAEHEKGIVCRFIAAGLRNHDPRLNVVLAKTAALYRESGVVGFDLAGDELNYPAQLHREAIFAARDGGLGITLHAGEAGGAENVAVAVQELGATRIGHGIHSIENPRVMELLKENDVLLELCPSSNVHTYSIRSIADHPVRKFFDYGIPIGIGDDDPTTSANSVPRELMVLVNQFGFTIAELEKVQLESIRKSFLESEEIKKGLVEKIKSSVMK